MNHFCSHCGNALGEKSLFCNQCGKRVGENPPEKEANLSRETPVVTPSKTAASEEWITQYRYGDRAAKNLEIQGKKLFSSITDWAGLIAFIYSVVLYASARGSIQEGLLIGVILSGGSSFLATVLHLGKYYFASGLFSFASSIFGLVCAAFPWGVSSYYFDIDDPDDISITIYIIVCLLLFSGFTLLSVGLNLSRKYNQVVKNCYISLTNTHVLGYYIITKSFNTNPKPTYFELNYSDIRAIRCDIEEDNNFFIDYIGGNIAMDLKEPEDAMKKILEKRREFVS